MFEIKNLDFGFIILSLDSNPVALKGTIRSLKNSHPDTPCVSVVSKDIQTDVITEMRKECHIFKSKNIVTSMLNVGMNNIPTEWGVFIVAGSWVKIKLAYKLSRFIDNENDILFPIVNRIYDFKNSSLNGLCISKKLFKKAGNFPEKGTIADCKEQWAINAVDSCSAKLKAILGVTIV